MQNPFNCATDSIQGFLPKTTINYKDTFGSHFVQGKAENINLREKRVMVDTGDIIQYTDLVVAVGSVGPFPGKSEYTTVKELQEASQALTTEVYQLSLC